MLGSLGHGMAAQLTLRPRPTGLALIRLFSNGWTQLAAGATPAVDLGAARLAAIHTALALIGSALRR